MTFLPVFPVLSFLVFFYLPFCPFLLQTNEKKYSEIVDKDTSKQLKKPCNKTTTYTACLASSAFVSSSSPECSSANNKQLQYAMQYAK